MRQRRWLELVKDYDCEILYYPWKANVMVDSLSQRGLGKLFSSKQIFERLAEDMTRARIELVVVQLANITIQSTLFERIREAQRNDPQLRKHQEDVLARVAKDFIILETYMLRYKDQICVPMDASIRQESERKIKILKDMLRACVLDFGES
ncbi:uncharacterized protein LOC133806838 [Humulus lupulus]|uniref:uncharacterized protein LOC133806838 n=1 Tax=Humulus lupulus TaxID=3486 RepID=UPI002B4126EA|nr:uncharacterized protein LOC133806838 [Humulus lupulus]